MTEYRPLGNKERIEPGDECRDASISQDWEKSVRIGDTPDGVNGLDGTLEYRRPIESPSPVAAPCGECERLLNVLKLADAMNSAVKAYLWGDTSRGRVVLRDSSSDYSAARSLLGDLKGAK